MNALICPFAIAALLLPNTLANVPARAQSTPDDQSPGSPQQVEAARAILPRVGTDLTPVMPTRPKVSIALQPGLTEGHDWLADLHETLDEPTEPSTLAEGAFVLHRKGQLLPGPSGLMIFVPDKATRLPGEGPVLLMPCRTLEELETQWSGQPVEVSGEIFTYHNRNQLLLSAYRIAPSHHEPADQSPAEPTDPSAEQSPEDPEPASIEDDPDVRDLLDELEFNIKPADDANDSARRILEPISGQTTRRPQMTRVTSTNGLDEGTLILRRPGRMIRNASGAWAIVFDHDDPDAPDRIELIVEPCTMLMRMEQIAMQTGDAGKLLVSGRIYTYKGAHYILPTLMQHVRPQGINSLQ